MSNKSPLYHISSKSDSLGSVVEPFEDAFAFIKETFAREHALFAIKEILLFLRNQLIQMAQMGSWVWIESLWNSIWTQIEKLIKRFANPQ